MRALFKVSLLACALLSGFGAANASPDSKVGWLDEKFDVVVRDQRLGDVLLQFGSMVGSPVYVSPQVKAQVSARFDGASGREILDALAREHGLDWRFDGRRIEVTSQGEQVSRLLDLEGVSRTRLVDVLEKLGLFDESFPISAVDGALAYMTAPPRYVAAVEAVLADLIDREARESQERARLDEVERIKMERQAAVEAEARKRADALEAQRIAELAAERRLSKELAEKRRAESVALAERRRAEALAEKRRAEQLAEKRRAEALVERRRAQALAEQRRAQALAAQQRALEEARRNAAKQQPTHTGPLIIRGGVWGG